MLRQKSATVVNPRDSVVALCGVITAQLAMFVCVYLLGHWHGQGALGRFNYWLAIGSFTSSVLAFRFELACADDQPSASFSAFIHSSVIAVAVTLATLPVIYLLGDPDYYVIALFSLASFIQIAASLYYNSLRSYGKVALPRTAINVLFVAYLVCDHFRARSDGSDPFVWYSWISAGVAFLMTISIVRGAKKEGFSLRISRRFFVENRRFAIYILPSTVCESLVSCALAVVIPRWYGVESAGYFAVAYRLGFFPVSLIGQSLGGVFRRDALSALSENGSGMELRRVYATYGRTLTALAALYALGAILLFAPIVRLTFGPSWQETIDLYFHLLPWFTLQIIFLPLAQIFLAARAQRTHFLIQFTSCVALWVTLYMARMAGLPVQECVQAFSVSATALTILGIALTYRSVNVTIALSSREA
ncbi:oligosaccharide flippase family protein [Paraburkholderia sp. JPY432]|uniref:oligosaccharide flippase family protein n=1 Tax=Paraburkholderia youngii TaxID=2782701 RepID=UPI001595465C|nr:oligosaccharide flippase family protein [Paraburkholderia youngii]NVH74249.1 oligosaccharide flippase family protein [Paraburkholderia youngii]